MDGINKQMFCLEGMPVLIHSLMLLEKTSALEGIILVVPPDELPRFEEETGNWGLKKIIKVVSGGANRQQSVYFGLLAIPFDCDFVLIHDGARPLVTSAEVGQLIDSVLVHGAATLAVPVKDTVKAADHQGFVVKTLDRDVLWLTQTPQAFRYEIIMAAHRTTEEKKHIFTDDASMVEAVGQPVKIVRGSYRNIKITTREDLIVASAFLDKKN